ncbi:putative transcriptional regulatory protein pdtaR [Novipirellula galeiformis]|uniref:Putative transcriptional regulatory protein pdtaR n=1 Tax=Novipirellula galeiformis TaxID=2528004 RepID=A0A5C6CQT0_9BACT|nr:response regulator [Novipirellula galeiformis]TWU25466.1 putative transcriptional regulatory protein pdtaR [Novipirellula galeiformis]
MNTSLRIVVADDDPAMCEYMQTTLTLLGHQVVGIANSGQELVQQCRQLKPKLVITDLKMPEMDGLEAIKAIGNTLPIAFILVSAHHDSDTIARALDQQVLAYLVKPIKRADLETAIAVTMRRFAEFQALFQQTDSLRQSLEDRKTIEKAKGVLMQRAGIDEPDAFKRLQKMASDNNWKLAEAAKYLLATDQALQ